MPDPMIHDLFILVYPQVAMETEMTSVFAEENVETSVAAAGAPEVTPEKKGGACVAGYRSTYK